LWKLKVSGLHYNHCESLGRGQVAEWKHQFPELRASLSTNRKFEQKCTPSGFDVGSVPEMKASGNTKLSGSGRNVREEWRKLSASNVSAHLIGSKFAYFGWKCFVAKLISS
jgi:hypothetical protein